MPYTSLEVFDKTLQKSQAWLSDVMAELGSADRQEAYRALRAVLHVLRDRLGVEEAADLGAQMPMLIRGLYFESWRPTGKPLRIRKREDFLAAVCKELGDRRDAEIPRIVRAVLRVLEEHISQGEIEDVKHCLPSSLRALWPHEAASTS